MNGICKIGANVFGIPVRRGDKSPPALNQTKMKTQINNEIMKLKWYAIPQYSREGWRILNEKGELVAVFEDRRECEHVVYLHNLTLD